jgi:hypothetical protein
MKPVAQPAREGAVECRIRDRDEVVIALRPSSVTVSDKLGYMLETPLHPVVLAIAITMAVTIHPVRTISREVFVTPQRLHAELPTIVGMKI